MSQTGAQKQCPWHLSYNVPQEGLNNLMLSHKGTPESGRQCVGMAVEAAWWKSVLCWELRSRPLLPAHSHLPSPLWPRSGLNPGNCSAESQQQWSGWVLVRLVHQPSSPRGCTKPIIAMGSHGGWVAKHRGRHSAIPSGAAWTAAHYAAGEMQVGKTVLQVTCACKPYAGQGCRSSTLTIC